MSQLNYQLCINRGNIKEAAAKVLGTRHINGSNKKPNKTSWFLQEIKDKCEEKKKACSKYLTTRTQELYEQYKKK